MWTNHRVCCIVYSKECVMRTPSFPIPWENIIDIRIRVEIKQVKRSQLMMREKNDTNRISKTAWYSISWQTTSPCSTTSGRVRGDFPDNCKQQMIINIYQHRRCWSYEIYKVKLTWHVLTERTMTIFNSKHNNTASNNI